jgi:hypothetical protein
MTTRYPNAIDGYQEIRVARDGIDEIVAGDHNDERSAIIAIEQTLGTNPEGAFGTVSARLDDSYQNIEYHMAGGDPKHPDTHITANAKSSVNFSLNTGTVSSQLSDVLTNLEAVDGLIASVVTKIIDSFVLSGMAVTQSGGGPDATVASGFVMGRGFIAPFSGGSIAITSSPGTYYVYAQVSGGTVTIGQAPIATLPIDPVDTIVILHKVTHSGGAWTDEVDLRRYGSHINNKNYFTVGTAPSSGKDGYGADFTSLEAAVEYIRALNSISPQNMIAPKKIILVDGVDISGGDGYNINLDIEGFEIDGCNQTITRDVGDAPIFNIEADNITIKNLNVSEELLLTPSASCLAKIGESNSVKNITLQFPGADMKVMVLQLVHILYAVEMHRIQLPLTT